MRCLLNSFASWALLHKSESCIIDADHMATSHVMGKHHVALVFDEVNLDGCGDGSRGVHLESVLGRFTSKSVR